MRRKLYDEPVLEVIDIKYEDVICTSIDTEIDKPFGNSSEQFIDF